jgi:hypothetical protein
MQIKTTVNWPDGRVTVGEVNYNDPAETENWYRVSRAALRRGAMITLTQIESCVDRIRKATLDASREIDERTR